MYLCLLVPQVDLAELPLVSAGEYITEHKKMVLK